jgi:hypothetical protein
MHPGMTENYLEDPYCHYNIIQFVPLQLAEQAEPDSIKKSTTNKRLHQVVSKSHLSDRAHHFKNKLKPA